MKIYTKRTSNFRLPAMCLLAAIYGLTACGGGGATSNSSNNNNGAANAPVSSAANAAGDNQTVPAASDAEKEKLQRERRDLEREKQKLKQEKAGLEKMRNAQPPGDMTELPDESLVFAPPSHIRDAPDGKILCTVGKRTTIKLHGWTNIRDENGAWIYTDHCGKMGVIHSSQVGVAG